MNIFRYDLDNYPPNRKLTCVIIIDAKLNSDADTNSETGSDRLDSMKSPIYNDFVDTGQAEYEDTTAISAEGIDQGDKPALRVFYYMSTFRLSEKRLCYNSPFFQAEFRDDRPEQGICAICRESIYNCPPPRVSAAGKKYDWQTGCVSCYQLFHWICLSTWRRCPISKQAGDKCPLCRQPWLLPLPLLFPALEPEAVVVYFECILNGWAEVETTPDMMLSRLIECYAVGVHFENQGFCLGVLQAVLEMCSALGDAPREEEIRLVYYMAEGYRGLRELFVGMWRQRRYGGMKFWGKEGDGLPEQFLVDLEIFENDDLSLLLTSDHINIPLDIELVLSGTPFGPGIVVAVCDDLEAAAIRRKRRRPGTKNRPSME